MNEQNHQEKPTETGVPLSQAVKECGLKRQFIASKAGVSRGQFYNYEKHGQIPNKTVGDRIEEIVQRKIRWGVSSRAS